jgi:hypothetical protein
MSKVLSEEDMEKFYDRVARAIDALDEQQESLFLGKLCLTLAHKLGDLEQAEEAIGTALQDLG